MGVFSDYFGAIARSVTSLGDGLAVTFSYLLRRPVTIQYPDRTVPPVVAMLPERSRGLLEFDADICTACNLCAKTCPIDCIHVVIEKNAEGTRMLTGFAIELNKCMHCGLCVEVCNTGALRHTQEFEAAVDNVDALVLRFISEPRQPAKAPKKGEALPPTKPRGSILRSLLPPALGNQVADSQEARR